MGERGQEARHRNRSRFGAGPRPGTTLVFLRIILRKTATHFCWKCCISWRMSCRSTKAPSILKACPTAPVSG
ncbi:hypothetical protein FGI60_18835 [Brucella haematophila]|nr:hypothetical protein F9K79_12415 [Ochrobactrum sp. Kaboul]TMU96105.1 hypothetical protein FGI60_18835 [Brucella haematophila]